MSQLNVVRGLKRLIIKVLRVLEAEPGEVEIINTVILEEIDVFRIKPINELVGTLLTFKQVSELVSSIRPYESLSDVNAEELELYYSQDVDLIKDGSLSHVKMDIPHHIGARVAIESILQQTNSLENIRIEIA